jgi:hypothetical protein
MTSTSRRWSTFVSGFVLTMALAAGGPARAQWGFPINSGPFGAGYGTGIASGFSPDNYGSFGGLGYGGFGGIGFSPIPGYAQASGQIPQTTASFQSTFDVVTTVPRWSGSTRRVRRRH